MKINRTRILFAMGRLGDNGATRSLLALLRILSKDKYDVSLFLCLDDNKVAREALPFDVRIVPGVLEYEINRLPLIIALRKAVKSKRLDLVRFRIKVAIARLFRAPQYPCWNALPCIEGQWDVVVSYADGWLSSMVIRKFNNGKKILWIHEDYERDMKPLEVIYSFRKADAIVGVSRDAIHHIRNILGESIDGKAHVVHNIIDPDEVRKLSSEESIELSNAKYNIISVGRIAYEKGFDIIPFVLSRLVKIGLDVHWSIVGTGLGSIINAIMADAKALNVEHRIHFLGAKSNPHPYTKAADCFVQPSKYEGWGMTISEAISLNVPVVVSDIPVFHEQVVEGENGFFAHDAESFAQAIERVLYEGLPSGRMKGYPCSPDNVLREFDSVIERLS